MKILQLCKKFPYPVKDGESIAVLALGKSLHQLGAEVTLLAMNTSRHYFPHVEAPAAFDHYASVHTSEVDNRIRPMGALRSLLANQSYHVARFDCQVFHKKLEELLRSENFDVVQLETLYLAPYIPTIRAHSDAIIAMRSHNVEHEIWERIAGNTSFLLKRLYLKRLAKQLKEYETEQLSHYDLLVAITDRDKKKMQELGYQRASLTVPIGLPVEKYKADYTCYHQPRFSLSFIGSLDWMPNQEGLRWFLDNVWGQIHAQFPELSFHIAGRNTPDWLLNLQLEKVHVHGEVPDAAEFINRYPAMVVPLLSGSGMRAKILEAMALGKVTISTSIGLEGIGAQHQSEVLVADEPEAFLDAIRYCLQRGAKLEGMGRKAETFVSEQFGSIAVGKKLIKAYSNLIVEAV
jgi:glycosyltransferase involved in cell wall biosynthesis